MATLEGTARLSVERSVLQALRHARLGLWTTALVYVLSVLAGLFLVHSGNRYSLNYRDNLIGQADRESVILKQLQHGHSLTAAALDATANAAAGFLSMLSGYCPPAGYAAAGFRGWIGGIVSAGDPHRSRLATSFEAFYYLTTQLLQLIPSRSPVVRRSTQASPHLRTRTAPVITAHVCLGCAFRTKPCAMPVGSICSRFLFSRRHRCSNS